MQTDHFKEIGKDLFAYGWQTKLAKELGVAGSTVRRWVAGDVPLPPSTVAFLNALISRQITRGAYIARNFANKHPSNVKYIECEAELDIKKKLIFDTVQKPKNMPSIHHKGDQVSLGDKALDEIVSGIDYVIIRHPDSFHLKGFLLEQGVMGHNSTSLNAQNRYYSLSVFDQEKSKSSIFYGISTHQGQFRRLSINPFDNTIITNDTYRMPGNSYEEHIPGETL